MIWRCNIKNTFTWHRQPRKLNHNHTDAKAASICGVNRHWNENSSFAKSTRRPSCLLNTWSRSQVRKPIRISNIKPPFIITFFFLFWTLLVCEYVYLCALISQREGHGCIYLGMPTSFSIHFQPAQHMWQKKNLCGDELNYFNLRINAVTANLKCIQTFSFLDFNKIATKPPCWLRCSNTLFGKGSWLTCLMLNYVHSIPVPLPFIGIHR